VQQNRADALRRVDDLRREMDTLSRLVRSYVGTGETSYLKYYYAILAIREGERPLVDDDPTYWDQVSPAPRLSSSARPGQGFLRARMISPASTAPRLEALQQVLSEAEDQGPRAGRLCRHRGSTTRGRSFVAEGVPHPTGGPPSS
jgi:hypothetical protein